MGLKDVPLMQVNASQYDRIIVVVSLDKIEWTL